MTALFVVAAALAIGMAVWIWFDVSPKALESSKSARARAYFAAVRALHDAERDAMATAVERRDVGLAQKLAMARNYRSSSEYARVRWWALEEVRTPSAIELAESYLRELASKGDD